MTKNTFIDKNGKIRATFAQNPYLFESNKELCSLKNNERSLFCKYLDLLQTPGEHRHSTKDNRIYIQIKQNILSDILKISEPTIRRINDKLKEMGLIEIKKPGYTQCLKIFVTDKYFRIVEKEYQKETIEYSNKRKAKVNWKKICVLKGKKLRLRTKKIVEQEQKKERPFNIEKELNGREESFNYGKIDIEEIFLKIGIERIKTNLDVKDMVILNTIQTILKDNLENVSKKIINQKKIAYKDFASHISKLDSNKLISVIEKVKQTDIDWSRVINGYRLDKKKESYIRSMLYNETDNEPVKFKYYIKKSDGYDGYSWDEIDKILLS